MTFNYSWSEIKKDPSPKSQDPRTKDQDPRTKTVPKAPWGIGAWIPKDFGMEFETY